MWYIIMASLTIQGYLCTPLSATVNTKCEDVLQSETCVKLRGIAVVFHEKIGVVDEAVRSAVGKHVGNAQHVLDYVKKYLVDRANNFKCEDVLSTTQCADLKQTARYFHVSIASLTEDIEEAVVDGISNGKVLYQKTIEILLSKVKNLSCDQLISSDTCSKILSFATKIHASAQEVKRAIIDAYSKGLTNGQDFLKDAIDYLTNELSCDDVLSPLACSKLSYLCGKFGTSFTKMVGFLRSSYANGITQISSLYDAATKYIMESWMGLLPFMFDDISLEKRDADDEWDAEGKFIQFLLKVESHMDKSNEKLLL